MAPGRAIFASDSTVHGAMTAGLELLSCADAARLEFAWPDVYFSHLYGKAIEHSDQSTWEVAYYEPGGIVYPYLKRPIDLDLGDRPLHDLVSPYGYAGVWARGDATPQHWRAFRQAFRAVARDRGYIAEFYRFSSLFPGREALAAADPDVECASHNETVCLALKEGVDAYWANAEGRSRTAVRKATGSGYTFAVAPAAPADIARGSDFRQLYEATMARVDAQESYLFPEDYYATLSRGLGDRLLLGSVRRDDRVVAAALFMRWGNVLHYHLAGSEREAQRYGVNNLIIDGMVRWCCEHGVTRFHLGGGLGRDDALFRFKRGFGGESLPFFIGRCVLDPLRYQTLIARQADRLGITGETLLQGGFFPAYRFRPPTRPQAPAGA